MAEIRVCYPGAFLPTFGQHRFEVYIDDTLVKASPGYLRGWEAVVAVPLGRHRLEVRAINRLTGWRRSSFFSFTVDQEVGCRMHLRISHAWGSWREPLLEPLDAAQLHAAADGASRRS
jgi:hypothetical protein